MAGIRIELAPDLLYSTLQKFEKDMFAMTLSHTHYEALNQWFKKDKLVVDGGDQVNFYVQLKDSNNASHTSLFDTDNVNVANVMSEGVVKWTHAKTAWAFDVRQLAMNRGNATRVYNLLKSRVMAAYKDLADLLEEAAWKTPTDANDVESPHGVFGWLCQGSDGDAGAFSGYSPNYWTDSESTYDAGGISCSATVNPRHANFYADHDDKLTDDLLKLARRAFRKTYFQSPIVAGQALDPKSGFSNFRIYTNSDVLDVLEETALKSDDRVGADLGKYAGAVLFKNIPIRYVDILDDAKAYVYGGNPIVGVNHNHFHPVVLRDNNFRKTKPTPKSGSHNVLQGFVDLSYAYVCDNRRAGGWLISDFQDGN